MPGGKPIRGKIKGGGDKHERTVEIKKQKVERGERQRGTWDRGRGRGRELTEIGEFNVHTTRLEATQTVDEVFLLQPEFGLIMAVKETMYGHI